MTSKDDDTLPLPGFSQEQSTDASVDEDFIPTTQPESAESSKMSRNSEIKFTKSAEEVQPPVTHSKIEGTLSPEDGAIDRFGLGEDKSVDFIPNTETKETTTACANEDISCKKKLPVFQGEESFKDQSNVSWDPEMSKLAESPATENQSFSILAETPPKVPVRTEETDIKREEDISEIIVNDSADTVDLEQIAVKVKESESQRVEEKLDVSCSLNSDADTQLFDCSSVLVLGQPGSEKSERFNSFTPETSYLQETLDDDLQNVEVLNLEDSSSAVPELPKKKTLEEDLPKVNGNISPDKEVEEFKKPKPTFCFEPVSDSTSDKSKRHSTSSSGSVYSDKTGLPFALPKRVSTISDHTDSSEEDLATITEEQQRRLNRMPWCNEYLLPLKMDDIMQVAIENQKLPKRVLKSRGRQDKVNNLKQILESSSSEMTSVNGELQPTKTDVSEETLEKEETESLTLPLPEENKEPTENLNRNDQNDAVAHAGSAQCSDREGEASSGESELGQLNSVDEGGQSQTEVKSQTEVEDKGSSESSVVLREGLPVLARWTDKRYYSGVLCGSVKNDRWEVKFDDGALKLVRDDFIIPVEWLKAGALVFALSGDEYESGQIVAVNEGRKEVSYVVELDDVKKKVSVKISDLRLTEVMISIIKEKHRPIGCTPCIKPDIDFDNVLSGKRLREQKTPSRPQISHERGSSGGKKKSSSKAKKNDTTGLDEISATPMKGTGRTVRGLQSENGHLVEDKVISADSPSGNETTPARGNSKKTGLKPKPRSLSYDSEETRSRRTTTKSYLRADGTPIPGTSGVKFKKQKVSPKAKDPESPSTGAEVRSSKKNAAPPKVSQSTEKSRRKRKLDESQENSAQKTAMKDETIRSKRRLRNL